MLARSFISLLLFIALITSAAGRQPRRKRDRASAEQPAASAESEAPSVRLSRFVTAHLDQILAPVGQQASLPRPELSQLRASFLEEEAKAPERKRAQYQSAIAVCDALGQVMDEREKFVAATETSTSAPVVEEVHDARVSLPRRGRGSGKAARAALHQQESQNQQAQDKAAQKTAFLDSGKTKQWAERAAGLRQNIQQLMARQQEAERAAEVNESASSPAPAAPPP